MSDKSNLLLFWKNGHGNQSSQLNSANMSQEIDLSPSLAIKWKT